MKHYLSYYLVFYGYALSALSMYTDDFQVSYKIIKISHNYNLKISLKICIGRVIKDYVASRAHDKLSCYVPKRMMGFCKEANYI